MRHIVFVLSQKFVLASPATFAMGTTKILACLLPYKELHSITEVWLDLFFFNFMFSITIWRFAYCYYQFHLSSTTRKLVTEYFSTKCWYIPRNFLKDKIRQFFLWNYLKQFVGGYHQRTKFNIINWKYDLKILFLEITNLNWFSWNYIWQGLQQSYIYVDRKSEIAMKQQDKL